ncbi:hypothetical protein [Cellvibrio zantedeschiae]|nr:hypothetical protein [Cellvibrio zantedeschiae]
MIPSSANSPLEFTPGGYDNKKYVFRADKTKSHSSFCNIQGM